MAKKKKKENKAVVNEMVPKLPTWQPEPKDDFYKMQFDSFLQKRQEETEGLEICKKCGGVLWDIGEGSRKCGDCGDVTGECLDEDEEEDYE